MRRKKEAVLSFESKDDGLPKVVRDYRARYRAISQVLDAKSDILSAVHADLQKLSQGGKEGREGDYTSENILRALVVQHLEGLPFRDVIIRIGSDPFLQDFLRMRKKAVMDFTFLDKCFSGHPSPDLETGQRIAGPVRRCPGSGEHAGHSYRHHCRGIEYPLSHGLVASLGHLAGGIAAVETGKRDCPGELPAPLP